MKPNPAVIRCAIYTRVSDDDGLDQEFNSLDAQREAGEYHIKAQVSAGWVALPNRYDDGGISGKDLERPAVQQLINDIKAGKIDIVVVYKIDRLSRTVADFVDLMKLFDQYNVSFVSVTQHFNTDSAMGKLILNILQSFAQFEREMTAERIRDKIAASKRKGMWMGGAPPLGYDIYERKLVINETEAVIIRHIFQRFLETGSTTLIVHELEAKGWTTKDWISVRKRRHHKGQKFNKTAIYHILRNPIYMGKVSHKGEFYSGQHMALIDPATWDKAQSLIDGRIPKPMRMPHTESPALLRGLLFDPDGYAMCTGGAKHKNKTYRYYVSTQAVKKSYDHCPLKTVSAHMLEEIVVDQVRRLLVRPEWAVRISKAEHNVHERTALAALKNFESLWDELFPAEQSRILNLLIQKIVVHPRKLQIIFRPLGMTSLLHEIISDFNYVAPADNTENFVTIEIPIAFKNRGGRKHIIAPDGGDLVPSKMPRPDKSLIRAIVRGYEFLEKMDADPSLNSIKLGKTEKIDPAYVNKYIRMTQLAPDIVVAILNGRQPKTLSVSQLQRPFPDLWAEQRAFFGFSTPTEGVH